MRRIHFAAIALAGLLVATADAAPLAIVVDFDNSKGLEKGDALRSGRDTIGKVTRVGFGDGDTVEVGLRVDEKHRDVVRQKSTFVIVKASGGEAVVEHYVLDPASPSARDGARFTGVRSIAEVWLRRGRITSEELSQTLSRGVDEFQQELEALRKSPEWAKFRDQLTHLTAELTVTGQELARLLNEQLPKLQRELDDLHRRYLEEVERQKRERSGAEPGT